MFEDKTELLILIQIVNKQNKKSQHVRLNRRSDDHVEKLTRVGCILSRRKWTNPRSNKETTYKPSQNLIFILSTVWNVYLIFYSVCPCEHWAQNE